MGRVLRLNTAAALQKIVTGQRAKDVHGVHEACLYISLRSQQRGV